MCCHLEYWFVQSRRTRCIQGTSPSTISEFGDFIEKQMGLISQSTEKKLRQSFAHKRCDCGQGNPLTLHAKPSTTKNMKNEFNSFPKLSSKLESNYFKRQPEPFRWIKVLQDGWIRGEDSQKKQASNWNKMLWSYTRRYKKKSRIKLDRQFNALGTVLPKLPKHQSKEWKNLASKSVGGWQGIAGASGDSNQRANQTLHCAHVGLHKGLFWFAHLAVRLVWFKGEGMNVIWFDLIWFKVLLINSKFVSWSIVC